MMFLCFSNQLTAMCHVIVASQLAQHSYKFLPHAVHHAALVLLFIVAPAVLINIL
jgi:hypothetical protein